MNIKRKNIMVVFSIIFIMLLFCLILYQPFMNFLDNPQSLRHYLQSFGFLGIIIYMMIMSIQVIFVFLPGEIVEIMAGYLYGPIGGLFVCLAGSLLGSLIIYIIVKRWGIRFISYLINIDQLKEISFLKNSKHLSIILFIIFLIPGTPKDIFTYFIPFTDIKFSHFLIITTIARIPSIITSTIGGHAIGIENYVFSLIVFVITGIISLVGLFVYKRIIHKQKIPEHL